MVAVASKQELANNAKLPSLVSRLKQVGKQKERLATGSALCLFKAAACSSL